MGNRKKRKAGIGGNNSRSGQRQSPPQSSLSLFTNGFINPALLAQHAAAAAAASSAPTTTNKNTKSNTPGSNGSKGSNSSTKKKRKRKDDNCNQHDDKPTTTTTTKNDSETKKANKKSKKNESCKTNDNASMERQSKVSPKANKAAATTNSMKNDTITNERNEGIQPFTATATATTTTSLFDSFIFGHARWRRIEQLCFDLLFSSPYFISNTNNNNNNNTIRQIPKIVFVSSSAKAKKFANLFKPMISPKVSFACHCKVKRNQLRTILTRMVCGNDNDSETTSTDTDSNIGDHVLFVQDKSMKLLQSVCEEVFASLTKKQNNHHKKKKKKKNKKMSMTISNQDEDTIPPQNGQTQTIQTENIEEKNGIGNTITIVGLYYDHPASIEMLHQRRDTIQSFAKLFLPSTTTTTTTMSIPPPLFSKESLMSSSSSSPKIVELILDGTLDKKIDSTDDDDENSYDDSSTHDCHVVLNSIKPTPSSLQTLIAPSDRPLTQAIVNASERLLSTKDTGSDRAKSASDRLKANLAILDVRLASLLQRKEEENRNGTNEGDEVVEENVGKKGKGRIKSDNAATVMKKMKVLGMICDTRVGGSKREAALTQWLDGADGKTFGGAWCGPIRQGASGEEASRKLATLLRNARLKNVGGSSSRKCGCAAGGKGSCWLALSKWRSNPAKGDNIETTMKRGFDSDEEETNFDNSRDFGNIPHAKACGHNETTMFFLRPFAAVEVLNSRVCSKSSPAPGNTGYEGCLEFLQRISAAEGRGMTFWDSECFAFIDGKRKDCQEGKMELAPVSRLMKKDLLFLSHETLVWLIDAMRQWTIYRENSREDSCHPRKILDGIDFSLGLLQNVPSAKKKSSKKARSLLLDLRPKLICHVLSFVFPGNVDEWKTIGSVKAQH